MSRSSLLLAFVTCSHDQPREQRGVGTFSVVITSARPLWETQEEAFATRYSY